MLDDIAGFLGNSQAQQQHGAGILGHLFGQRQDAVANSVSRMSGLDHGQVGRLLMMLAPLVMGALGRERQSQRLDSRGLAGLLSNEHQRVAKSNPRMGMLEQLLDQDDDGSVMDDVAKVGMGFLGKILGGR